MTADTVYMVLYFDLYYSFKQHVKTGNKIACVVHTSTDLDKCKRIASSLENAYYRNSGGKRNRKYFVKVVTQLTFNVPVINF